MAERPVSVSEPPDVLWSIEEPGDDANFQPQLWPECPSCNVPWVWRRYISLGRGYVWAWSKDCKHKAQPMMMTPQGRYEPDTHNDASEQPASASPNTRTVES